MTWPQPRDDEELESAFLVERYLSPAAATDLATSTARLARFCADADPTGVHLRYLYSAYLPAEDTCFCLFRAPSSDAVRSINQRADFAFDRVTDAVLMLSVESDTPPNQGDRDPGTFRT
jgi:Protein of unknown function (DUF4242)